MEKIFKKNKYWQISIIIFSAITNLILLSSCGNDSESRVIDPEIIDTSSKMGGEGKKIFYQKCASCHLVFKTATGPPLSKIAEARDSVWIFNFLTNRKSIKEDSISLEFKRAFTGINCMIFPDMSQGEVGKILKYISEAQHPHY